MHPKDKSIIHIYGGLGNQMFQYAFFIHLTKLGFNTSINTGYFNNRSERLKHGSEFLLPKIFKHIKTTGYDDWKSKTMYLDTLLWTIIRRARKFYFRRSNVLETFHLITSQNLDVSTVNTSKQHYRDYWQNIEFISNNEKELRHAFTFNTELLSKKNLECIKLIQESNSVSIHVRRGDYLIHKDIYGNICSKDYYYKALGIIEKQVSNPRYFIFSDDLDWCRDFFADLAHATFVYWNENAGHFDMYLMSKCKHNIIANSSFSWWGAWLNQNPEKQVILTYKWNSKRTSNDLKLNNWIQIK